MGRFTTWDKGYEDKREIRRVKKHQKVDIAISILKHDGVKVTAKEVNRLMKFHKTGLVTIFHDDHHGKRITKSGLHGGRYVKDSNLNRYHSYPVAILSDLSWVAGIAVVIVLLMINI